MVSIATETETLTIEVVGETEERSLAGEAEPYHTIPSTPSNPPDEKEADEKKTLPESDKVASSDEVKSSSTPPADDPEKPLAKERTYTGDDIEMKYMIRKLLGMRSNDFAIAGENLSLRTHILDLRCPGFEHTTELSEPIPEAQFDAIRVNSCPILKALYKVSGEMYSKSSAPYIFWRPFVFFTENLKYLEGYLRELEANRLLTLKDIEATISSGPKPTPDTNTTRETDEELEINDLAFFIRFIKENLKEDFEKQRKFQSGEATEVAFGDLHNLFRQQPDFYVVGNFNDTTCGALRAYQIAGMGGGGRQDVPRAPNPGGSEGGALKEPNSPLELYLLYLDFNGNQFSVRHEMVKIHDYNGTLPIRGLKVFPINFLSPEERKVLNDRGEKFLKYAQGQMDGRGLHKYCTGISLNVIQGSREQVDSPVIVDHVFALQQNPEWVPQKKYDAGETPNISANWLQSGDSLGHSTPTQDSGIAGEWFITHSKKHFLEQCMRIQKKISGSISEQVQMLGPIRHITHSRVFAFVLRKRTWVSVNIEDVSDLVMQRGGFESLVLPKGHKELVKALVQMHSQPSQTSNSEIEQNTQLDLVRGKGKGLIVLLHGAPGVGKTSTAECVAEYANKPLFPITCGDIGYEPQEVTKNLEDNFRLAHKWDCVLLLDEADIFLAKRDRENLKRNSLVSIFLRVLEYYSGILFLTTNRVGTFDEAFKSRIHMSLYYPELSEKAYLQIWEMNLKRVQQIRPGVKVDQDSVMTYAKKKYPELQWNGRQIRNAIQTALALAEFRSYNTPDSPTIKKEDFQKVTKASKKFDSYLVEIYGNTDADRAHNDMLRVGRARKTPETTASKSGRLFAKDSSSSDNDSSDTGSSSSSTSHAKSKKEKEKKKKKAKKAKKAKKQKDSDSDDSSE